MTPREIKYWIDAHSKLVFNVYYIVATIIGIIFVYHYENIWWFFPPFISVSIIFLIVNYWFYKKL